MKKPKINILLVEDNQADADLMSDILNEKVQCFITWAKDGEEALARIRGEDKYKETARPDLILLDLNLPRLSGIEVLRAVKADIRFRQIPVFIFTSSGADRDVSECYDLNANGYIQKPADLDSYHRLVDTLSAFWIGQVTYPPKERRRLNV